MGGKGKSGKWIHGGGDANLYEPQDHVILVVGFEITHLDPLDST
jgi:hypothetical protein